MENGTLELLLILLKEYKEKYNYDGYENQLCLTNIIANVEIQIRNNRQ